MISEKTIKELRNLLKDGGAIVSTVQESEIAQTIVEYFDILSTSYYGNDYV